MGYNIVWAHVALDLAVIVAVVVGIVLIIRKVRRG